MHEVRSGAPRPAPNGEAVHTPYDRGEQSLEEQVQSALNLFLTQKRVYRQRWWGAPIAFFTIGTLYLCLVSFTALGALVAILVSL